MNRVVDVENRCLTQSGSWVLRSFNGPEPGGLELMIDSERERAGGKERERERKTWEPKL